MPDEFYPSRDHNKGPGEWCVRGPKNFYIFVHGKMMAYGIASYLNGDMKGAACFHQYINESMTNTDTFEYPRPPLKKIEQSEFEKNFMLTWNKLPEEK